jgi:hypothetical protein
VLPAASDGNDLVRAAAQLFLQVVNQEIDAAASSHHAGQHVAADRFGRGKDGSLHP